MEKKVFALLCTLLLIFLFIPAVVETVEQQCDNCDQAGIPVEKRADPEYRDGIYGQWIQYCCPYCGLPYDVLPASWRQLEAPATPVPTPDPTPVPAPDPTPAPIQAPAVPETPVSAPKVTDPPVTAQKVTDPPVVLPASDTQQSSATASQTQAPVISGSESLSGSGSVRDGTVLQESEPAPVSSGNGAGGGNSGSGKPAGENKNTSTGNGNSQGRNYEKYPVFSSVYPARRLNLSGNPDAKAPIPGVKIWPAEGADSLLRNLLSGD